MKDSERIGRGLLILNQYGDSELDVMADHTGIIAGPVDMWADQFAPDDIAALRLLGWCKDEKVDNRYVWRFIFKEV